MQLKPQDILVALKLVVSGQLPRTYASLAVELGMSPSEIHAASKRLLAAGLVFQEGQRLMPNLASLSEFLQHGLRYVFLPVRGAMTRGMATAHAAPVLSEHFQQDPEPPPVWPDPDGDVRGQSFEPLYKSAPKAARNEPALYDLLALIDAIRGGRARERKLAAELLKQKLLHQNLPDYGHALKSE